MTDRDKRQHISIVRWGKAGCRGTVEGATGYGKSRVAMKGTSRLLERYPTEEAWQYDLCVVVPTIVLKNEWIEKLQSFGFSNFLVEVINTIVETKTRARVLIPDEIHRYASEVFGLLFQAVEYEFIMGLTATMPTDEKRLYLNKYCPVIDRITLKECEDRGWTSPYELYALVVRFSEKEKEKYKKHSDAFDKNFGWFSQDWNLMKKCLSDASYRASHARFLGISPQEVMQYARGANAAVRARTKMIHNAQVKIDAAIEVLETIEYNKAIIFCESINATEEVRKHIGDRAVAYHSKIKGGEVNGKYIGAKRMREHNLNLFRDPDSGIDVICTARALDQGTDIPAIDLAIIVSGTSQGRQAVQRRGRSLRKVEGKNTIIVEIYIEGTQDERWFNSRTSTLDKNVNYITDPKEIQQP